MNLNEIQKEKREETCLKHQTIQQCFSIQENIIEFVYIISNLAMFTWNTAKTFLDTT